MLEIKRYEVVTLLLYVPVLLNGIYANITGYIDTVEILEKNTSNETKRK